MIFEYLQRVVVDSQIDVENTGECCIRGRNDFGEEFYLVIHTEMGTVEVYDYGKAMPDIDQLPEVINIKYSRFPYSSSKLETIIDKFLNDGKKFITQADVVTLPEIRDNFINPIDKIFPVQGGDIGEKHCNR